MTLSFWTGGLPNVSKDYVAVIFRVAQHLCGQLYPKDEGKTNFRNVGNYSPNDTGSLLRRPATSLGCKYFTSLILCVSAHRMLSAGIQVRMNLLEMSQSFRKFTRVSI
jgi:hypothetical protein